MFAILLLSFFRLHNSALIDYESVGAIPNDDTYETALKNGNILNSTLATLKSGDVFLVQNKTYTLVGGIIASNIKGVKFQIDGENIIALVWSC
jgi:hypothetical protein